MSEVSAAASGAAPIEPQLTAATMIDPLTGHPMPPARQPAVGTLALNPEWMAAPTQADLTLQQRYNLIVIAHSGHPAVGGWALDTLERSRAAGKA